MPLADPAERTLARSGYRLTAPRRALLDKMRTLGNHFTAEEVQVAAPEVGRATVFRTMKLMRELGVVCQVVLDDGTLAYRLAPEEHHHHVLCVECGAAEDFSSPALESVLREVEESTGFTVEAHRLELYGRCAACRAGVN